MLRKMDNISATLVPFCHDLSTAQHLINQWGAERRPFFFVINYHLTQSLVIPLDSWPQETLYFEFAGRRGSHFPAISVGQLEKVSSLPSQIEWKIAPPSLSDYKRAFEKVQHHLHRGDSFLTNLTFSVPVSTNLTLRQIYHFARAPYKLLWDNYFVCFSPEPFVEISEGMIRTFPMKGTIDGTGLQAEQRLMDNVKEKAEHATIVDLLRNDLSQVATRVQVLRYRYVEEIQTHRGALLQTSSEIVGQLPENYLSHLGDILFPLLPAGSITGAPKQATMQSIAKAETYERGFYTGVMGHFDGTSLQSAVMIRFIEQQQDGSLLFKAGGGITTRSDVESEYQELLDKVYAPVAFKF